MTRTAMVIAGVALICVSYLLYPSPYRAIADYVFGAVYRYDSASVRVADNALQSPVGYQPLSVIATPPQTPYDSLIAVRLHAEDTDGRHSAITMHEYVFNAEGVPIGYVDTIHRDFYTIALLSSPLAHDAFGLRDYVASFKGLGGGGLSATIPLRHEVKEGDTVTHQGTGVSFGTIYHIKRDEEKESQIIFLTLPSNPLHLNQVFISEQSPHWVDVKAVQQDSI